jgi:hypothetical protein
MRMRALESIFPSRRGAKTCLFWIGMGNADNTGSGIGNHLVGTIPPEIGDFAELTRLVLHTNVISGQIPTELGKLTKLEELLAVRQIPDEIANLKQLRILSIDQNDLSFQVPNLPFQQYTGPNAGCTTDLPPGRTGIEHNSSSCPLPGQQLISREALVLQQQQPRRQNNMHQWLNHEGSIFASQVLISLKRVRSCQMHTHLCAVGAPLELRVRPGDTGLWAG